MTQMIVDEAGDKVIAVVVARLQAQPQWMLLGFRLGLQQLRLELAIEEIVAIALINQNRQLLRGLSQQRAGIPFAPARTVVTQITTEGLLAPRAVARVADRRKGRHRLIAPRIAQGADQRAVAAHGMPADTAPLRDRKSTR